MFGLNFGAIFLKINILDDFSLHENDTEKSFRPRYTSTYRSLFRTLLLQYLFPISVYNVSFDSAFVFLTRSIPTLTLTVIFGNDTAKKTSQWSAIVAKRLWMPAPFTFNFALRVCYKIRGFENHVTTKYVISRYDHLYWSRTIKQSVLHYLRDKKWVYLRV